MTSKERILNQAAFKPAAIEYQIASLTIALACTVVGIPLLLLARPIARWYWTRFYENLSVYLTSRDLKVHRGILNKEEKSIPLEKITDLAVFQGPIMRHYGVRGIRIETAGQSSGMNALVKVIGIEDVDTFRDLVLAQRDRITEREESPAASAPPAIATPGTSVGAIASDGEMLETLKDIHDTLRRIEERLTEQRA